MKMKCKDVPNGFIPKNAKRGILDTIMGPRFRRGSGLWHRKNYYGVICVVEKVAVVGNYGKLRKNMWVEVDEEDLESFLKRQTAEHYCI